MLIKTSTGTLEVPEDVTTIEVHSDEEAEPTHAMLVQHGVNGKQTDVPYVMILPVSLLPIANEIARELLAGTEEFPDENDIFAVPVNYGGQTDPRVVWYEV